jgi:hypothetical protein
MTSCVYHSLWTLVEFVKGECFNADDPLSTLNVIIFGLVSKQGQPWLTTKVVYYWPVVI